MQGDAQGVQTGEDLHAESVSRLGAGRAGEEQPNQRRDEVCVQGGAGVCGEGIAAGEGREECGGEDKVAETLGRGGGGGG